MYLIIIGYSYKSQLSFGLWRKRKILIVKHDILVVILLLFFAFYESSLTAWKHEVAIGFNKSRELGQKYTNKAMVISGKGIVLPKIDNTLFPSLDFTFADIYASTLDHNHLTTLAGSLAFRAYFSDPQHHSVRPYVQVSFGPAYLSHRQLGTRVQGNNFVFQSTLETGMEVNCQSQAIDLNLRLIHYCNAGIYTPNESINLVAVISIGYLF